MTDLGREGDERGRSEGLVCVDAPERVAQGVFLHGEHALVTAAPRGEKL